MSLPFIWPPNSHSIPGSGRLTEIASFRKSDIPAERFSAVLSRVMAQVNSFPISRQNLVGVQLENPNLMVLVADWTSAEEKDRFEPGDRYQSIKPSFGELVDPENSNFQCHHITLPHALPTTPEAGFYVISKMRVPASQQHVVAGAFQTYAATLTDVDGYAFIVMAASREDSELIVCFTGFHSQQDADKAAEAPAHKQLKEELDKVVVDGEKYGVLLTQAP